MSNETPDGLDYDRIARILGGEVIPMGRRPTFGPMGMKQVMAAKAKADAAAKKNAKKKKGRGK